MKECFYENGLRFTCRRGCVFCCSGSSGIVFLTPDDIRNISDAVDLNIEQVRRVYVRQLITDDGVEHDVLREYSDGRCVFLVNDGCSIYKNRPLQCRTYPFWDRILESKKTWDDETEYCPGINSGDKIVEREEIEHNRNLFNLIKSCDRRNFQEKIDNTVRDFVKKYNIVTQKKWAVAFSGGADSLALLISLSKINRNLVAIYVNHHIRNAEELSREIQLNEKNTNRLGIELVVLDMDKKELNALSREAGVEGSARTIRYRMIEEFCNKKNIEYVFTAHNRDDCDETDIINFFRGGNISRSIFPKISNYFRPLLAIAHRQNEQYVHEHGFEFSQDSTNLTSDALRTSIRHKLRPVLQDVFPSFENALEQRRNLNFKNIYQDCDSLFSSFTLLNARTSNNNRISRRAIEQIMNLAQKGNDSGRLEVGNIVVLHRKDDLVLFKKNESISNDFDLMIRSEGIYKLKNHGCVIVSTIKSGNINKDVNKFPSNIIVFKKDILHIRQAMLQDRILYNGKHRTIKDVLKKKQISATLLHQIFIIFSDDKVSAVYFDGFDIKPCISDELNIADLPDETELFMLNFV